MVETGRTGNSNVGCSCDSGDSGFPSTRHRHNSLIGSRGRRPPVRPRWLTRGHEFPSPRRLGILGERVAGDTIAKGRSLDGGALMDRGRDGDLRRLRSSVGWWRRGIRPAGRSLPELPGLPRSPMSRVFSFSLRGTGRGWSASRSPMRSNARTTGSSGDPSDLATARTIVDRRIAWRLARALLPATHPAVPRQPRNPVMSQRHGPQFLGELNVGISERMRGESTRQHRVPQTCPAAG